VGTGSFSIRIMTVLLCGRRQPAESSFLIAPCLSSSRSRMKGRQKTDERRGVPLLGSVPSAFCEGATRPRSPRTAATARYTPQFYTTLIGGVISTDAAWFADAKPTRNRNCNTTPSCRDTRRERLSLETAAGGGAGLQWDARLGAPIGPVHHLNSGNRTRFIL
jgi:hypothetical protein